MSMIEQLCWALVALLPLIALNWWVNRYLDRKFGK